MAQLKLQKGEGRQSVVIEEANDPHHVSETLIVLSKAD